jgi:hypothetical protein
MRWRNLITLLIRQTIPCHQEQVTQNFTAVPTNHVVSRVAMNGPFG